MHDCGRIVRYYRGGGGEYCGGYEWCVGVCGRVEAGILVACGLRRVDEPDEMISRFTYALMNVTMPVESLRYVEDHECTELADDLGG